MAVSVVIKCIVSSVLHLVCDTPIQLLSVIGRDNSLYFI